MTPNHRRNGRRAPILALLVAFVATLVLPTVVVGADWTNPKRVTKVRGSRLDSLHQLSAARGLLHVVHPRIGPRQTDDRIVYQRSRDKGVSWTRERTLFNATVRRRHVLPNLAIASTGPVVAVAWRVRGPSETVLYVRTSRNDGRSFGSRVAVYATKNKAGIGVPAVAVGDDVVAVAWTTRDKGNVKVRVSRNGGKSFKKADTLGKTKVSIDCRKKVTDGLVGLVTAGKRVHVAWSHAPKRSCHAGSIRMRTSPDRGGKWRKERMVTKRRSYGWPELAARGRTVLATVQSPSGGLIVARSSANGFGWRDRVLKPRKGHVFSAGDVVLLPKGKAMVTFVDERVRKARLINTRLVSRLSRDDGKRFKGAVTIVPTAKRLRMAPNIAANGDAVSVVYQSGALDGSPRNIFAARKK